MASFRSFQFFGSLTAIALVLQLMLVQVMASSAELHHHCHDHSHEPEHPCVVTLMLQGGYACEVPDIKPVDRSAETPPVPVSLAVAIEAAPARGVGGLLACAPPRGP